MAKLGRLSLMMFLQYAVWGAWLPLAARYLTASPGEGGLGFTGTQMGTILGLAGSIAQYYPTRQPRQRPQELGSY